MNLIGVLQRSRSKAGRDRIVSYIGANPARFSELVNLFLEGPYRITQQASWPLSHCAERHPHLLKPHLKRILKNIANPEVANAVKRNTMRLLQFIDLPRALQGSALTTALALFRNKKEPIAVRVFSMTVVAKIASDQPALKNEFRMMIEDELPYASPAFLSRAKKILQQLK